MTKPLKRHVALQPVSREHHQGLLLAWKIREGMKRGIPEERITKYINWFWEHHLATHFRFEEIYIFPILGSDHPLILRALQEHQDLSDLMTSEDHTKENLFAIEQQIVKHIRFEERTLFQEIEAVASEKKLREVEEAHGKAPDCHCEDRFWVR